MLAGAAAIFALMLGLFLLVVYRPSAGRHLPPTSWIWAGGVIMPFAVLAALIFHGLVQGEYLLRGEDGASPLKVEARGRMWQWEFFYPDAADGRSSLGVLHIPAGRVVEVTATSEDVIHSFWVPRLGGKIDATPGHAARVRILADRPGTYGGICAEYCGTGHSGMRFEVRAHSEEDYSGVIERLTDGTAREEP